MPKLSNCIDLEFLQKLSAKELQQMQAAIGNMYMKRLTEDQQFAVRLRIAELDPSTCKDDNEFVQLSKELRLLLAFWTELSQFVEDCAKREVANSIVTQE